MFAKKQSDLLLIPGLQCCGERHLPRKDRLQIRCLTREYQP